MARDMRSILIGHRGEPETWPENSLLGFQSILEAGARLIEADVQVTADGIAVLSHDPSVSRITGTDLQVTATDYKTLRALPAGYPERFGNRYRNLHIARLDELVDLLQQWPDARAFIEVKQASIDVHGIHKVVETVLNIIDPILQQCILISFDYNALVHARKHGQLPIGWALREWSADNRDRALNLAPDYLFCNRKRLPPDTEPLWQGPWQWVVYTVNAASEVAPFLERGAQLIETNRIRQLLAEPGLEDLTSV
ncbi:MAG: glycerophosphodiester phosphodiesterase family protein [Pseudomonadota bacterium]